MWRTNSTGAVDLVLSSSLLLYIGTNIPAVLSFQRMCACRFHAPQTLSGRFRLVVNPCLACVSCSKGVFGSGCAVPAMQALKRRALLANTCLQELVCPLVE